MKTDYFLAKTEYYAPFPIFKLTSDLAIGDSNLATQILFSAISYEDIARSIQQIFGKLQLKPNENSPIANQAALNTATGWDAIVETAKTHLVSKEFGAIDLKLTVFSLPDPDSVELFNRTVYAEIKNIEHEQIYYSKFQIALDYHLVWETYAISYDLILQELDFYHEVVSRHGSALSVEGIDRIIDIGAGTGNVTMPLLRTGRAVTAVDISRAMLDRMRSKLSEQDKRKMTILQQD